MKSKSINTFISKQHTPLHKNKTKNKKNNKTKQNNNSKNKKPRTLKSLTNNGVFKNNLFVPVHETTSLIKNDSDFVHFP